MRLVLPALLQIGPDKVKETCDCNLAEFIWARDHEADADTREQLDQLLQLNGQVWADFPRMIVRDMIEPGTTDNVPSVGKSHRVMKGERDIEVTVVDAQGAPISRFTVHV